MSGSLIGLSQLAKLKKKADGLLLQMAKQLRGGEISALPAEGRSYKEVCKYCDYKTVCAYEDGIPVRALSDDKLADVLAALSKGMKTMKWTEDQQKAIEARKGTLLVSAAAGSGKTAVLVERVIQRLCDSEDPCGVEQLLIVTFTNAPRRR